MRFSRSDFHQASFTRNHHKNFTKICNGKFHAANFQGKLRTNFLTKCRTTNSLTTNSVKKPRNSARRTVSLRVEQFREARIFLQKCEIFIIARVIAIFWP
jgi:hypothetical protein